MKIRRYTISPASISALEVDSVHFTRFIDYHYPYAEMFYVLELENSPFDTNLSLNNELRSIDCGINRKKRFVMIAALSDDVLDQILLLATAQNEN